MGNIEDPSITRYLIYVCNQMARLSNLEIPTALLPAFANTP